MSVRAELSLQLRPHPPPQHDKSFSWLPLHAVGGLGGGGEGGAYREGEETGFSVEEPPSWEEKHG